MTAEALARRALAEALSCLAEARAHPEDYRADLAARTLARDALRYAEEAKDADAPSPETGPVIRTRAA